MVLDGQALAYVPIDFADGDAYLDRLPKDARRYLKRKLRSREQIAVRRVPTGEAYADDARVDAYYALYEQVYAQSEIHFDRLTRPYFAALLRDGGSGGIVFEYRHAETGQMLGWNLCFDDGERLTDKYIGLSYPASREMNLYFVSWMVNLEYALERGLRHYIAGWTDPGVKALLGARFTATRHVVYVRNPLLRAVARRFPAASPRTANGSPSRTIRPAPPARRAGHRQFRRRPARRDPAGAERRLARGDPLRLPPGRAAILHAQPDQPHAGPADHGTVFMGSGDFHHLSWPLIERCAAGRAPASLRVVVLDNHPDNMRFPWGVHCGSWVRRVARLPQVAHVHVIGITSGDLGAAHAWEHNLGSVWSGKVTYWSTGVDTRWSRWLGLGPRFRSFPDRATLVERPARSWRPGRWIPISASTRMRSRPTRCAPTGTRACCCAPT